MITVYAAGSCGRFVENLRDHGPVTRHRASQYVRGYITAHNVYNRQQIAGDLSDSTIGLYLEKFCRDNPLRDLSDGVFLLARELGTSTVPRD